ncbi:M28 family peptidase [Marinilabiliaceae bacterium JC017]|nr:M28 family peptidase [Marinilabiliaceae bacterium JC017]
MIKTKNSVTPCLCVHCLFSKIYYLIFKPMKLTITSLTVLLLLISCQKNYNPGITQNELQKHITYLASDSLQGRKPGTLGDSLAADYIRARFKEAGLTLLAQDGYQPFDVVTEVKAGTNNNLSIEEEKLLMTTGFTPLGFTGNNTASAKVVFAGFGFQINEDSVRWNDYANVDATGKWVMAFRIDPDLDNPQSRFAAYSDDRYKVMTANDNGAAGLLLVNTTDYDKKDGLEKLRFDQSISTAPIPVIQITRQIANRILAGSGQTIEKLEKNLIQSKHPASFLIDKTVTGSTDVFQQKVPTRNVIAMVQGKNHPDEYIVAGAHFDHLGMGGNGSRCPDTVAVHNGADDNASGVAALIELAQHIAHNPLDRSVVFMAFGAEEMGLIGSKYQTANPVIDLKKIKTMINMDMVGRLDSAQNLTIGGTGTAAETDSLINGVLSNYSFHVKKSPEGTGPSDQSSFYVEGIPVLFITTGVHDQYHTPADDVERINFPGTEQVTRLVADIMKSYGSGNQTLTFKEAGAKQTTSYRRRLKVTLGIIPDHTSDVKGLGIDGVRPGGPAAKAGLLKDDIIIAIDGREISNIYDYMYRLAKFEKGQRISVEVQRGDKKEIFIVEL